MQRHGQCQLFGLIQKNRGVSRTLSKIQDEKFAKIVNGFYQRYYLRFLSLREKCPYSESFWSAFSRIGTEYGERRDTPYLSVFSPNAGKCRITSNTDTYAVYIISLVASQTFDRVLNTNFFNPLSSNVISGLRINQVVGFYQQNV